MKFKTNNYPKQRLNDRDKKLFSDLDKIKLFYLNEIGKTYLIDNSLYGSNDNKKHPAMITAIDLRDISSLIKNNPKVGINIITTLKEDENGNIIDENKRRKVNKGLIIRLNTKDYYYGPPKGIQLGTIDKNMKTNQKLRYDDIKDIFKNAFIVDPTSVIDKIYKTNNRLSQNNNYVIKNNIHKTKYYSRNKQKK